MQHVRAHMSLGDAGYYMSLPHEFLLFQFGSELVFVYTAINTYLKYRSTRDECCDITLVARLEKIHE